jgi:DNA-binding PadR family transcriptional regulator
MDRILEELFKHKTHFRDLMATDIHPNVLRKKLNAYMRKGFVKEEGRKDWKRGKKLLYSLTEKGRRECLRLALDDLGQSLRLTGKILSETISKPQLFEEWRKYARESFLNARIDKNTPVQEGIRRVEKVEHETYGSMNSCLRAIHEIVVKTQMPRAVLETHPESEYFIRINKHGEIKCIPEQLLENEDYEDDVMKKTEAN